MNKFALKKIPEIKGRILFSMLEVDGACQFEEFCSEIEKDGNLKKATDHCICPNDSSVKFAAAARTKISGYYS